MRVGSLFSGIGGFDLGFEQAGMTVSWQAEFDPAARNVLRHHWPSTVMYHDVKEVSSYAQPVDLICGGFPCQDVSVAGNRAGLAGSRSGLWSEFHRILRVKLPEWVVIENVPGLLSSNGGRDMGTVLGALGDLGYGWAYRVLDSQFFGVAQRRRRVFIVGCLGGEARASAVLLEPEGVRRNPPTRREARQNAAEGAAGGVAADSGVVTSLSASLGGAGPDAAHAQAGWLIPVLTSTGTDGNASRTLSTSNQRLDADTDTFVVQQDPVAFAWQAAGKQTTLGACADTHTTPTLPCSQTIAVAFSENQRAEVVTSPITRSLTGGGGKVGQGYQAALVGSQVRRLTPVECERLQGFPDGWTAPDGEPTYKQAKGGSWRPGKEGAPDSHRYKQLGNAVTVSVAQWLGNRIMAL